MCSNNCDSANSYNLSKFDELKRHLSDKLKNCNVKFKKFLVRDVIYKILSEIIKNDDDSVYVNYLDIEWWFRKSGNKTLDKELYDDTKMFVMLYSILGKYGHASRRMLDDVKNVVSFNLLSPLQFVDDEFGGSLAPNDDTKQCIRHSSIFKYADDFYVDIDALKWQTTRRFDISKKSETGELTADVEEYMYNSSHYGTVVLYDDETAEWIPVWSGQKIRQDVDYFGNYNIMCDCLELYDSTDKHNDFFISIARKSDIPQEFYKHYELTSSIDIPQKNICEKEIKWLKENKAELLLDRVVRKNPLFVACDVDETEDSVKFQCQYFSKMQVLEHKLLEFCRMAELVFDYKNFTITVKNYKVHQQQIEKLYNESK